MNRINKELDNEHLKILQVIDKLIQSPNKAILWDELYRVSKDHWDTENEYFKYGNKHKPPNHTSLKPHIIEHIKEHHQVLNDIIAMKNCYQTASQVRQLKQRIIHHINTMDTGHFSHWV